MSTSPHHGVDFASHDDMPPHCLWGLPGARRNRSLRSTVEREPRAGRNCRLIDTTNSGAVQRATDSVQSGDQRAQRRAVQRLSRDAWQLCLGELSDEAQRIRRDLASSVGTIRESRRRNPVEAVDGTGVATNLEYFWNSLGEV